MDTLNKVLHPKQTLHKTDDDTDFAATQTPPPRDPSGPGPASSSDPMRPNQQTLDALGSEPNVTGTDRPAPREGHHHPEQPQPQEQPQQGGQPRISRGHHHPRMPVGATGLPPNHRPREEGAGGPCA